MGIWRKNKNVVIKSDSNYPFLFYLQKDLKDDITLTSGASPGDAVVNISTGHGFTGADGEVITIWENNIFHQAQVTSSTVNTVTFNNPVGFYYTTNAVVIRGNINLNVDGSVTPYVSHFRVHGTNAVIPMQITGAKISMIHSTEADDSLYGDIDTSSTGVQNIMRFKNGTEVSLGVYQNNQDYNEFGWSVTYKDKAGGGSFSTNCEVDLEDKYKTALRLDPKQNHYVESTITGDLTDLDRHRIIIYGKYLFS